MKVISFHFRGENLKSPKKDEEERMDEGEDEEDIEEEDEEDEEEAEGQFLVDLEPGGNSSGRCGLHQKQSHQDEMSNAAALQVELMKICVRSNLNFLCRSSALPEEVGSNN